MVLGPAATDEATFTPKAALAELIEVSANETVLLLHLTSSERTCDAAPPLSAEEVAVAIRLLLPPGEPLAPGSFPRGPAAEGSRPLVATVKLGGRKHELKPGGGLSFSRVEASPQGALEGILQLEFPGDAEQPATRVSGRFLARFCKINRLR